MQQIPLKLWYPSAKLYCIIFQKDTILITNRYYWHKPSAKLYGIIFQKDTILITNRYYLPIYANASHMAPFLYLPIYI